MVKTTFLLVDDDADDTALFEEVLEQVDPSIGFRVATNGQEALEMLRSDSEALPDIIFLDLNMPRMDGRQCLAELQQDDRLKQIPVIMYTTSSQPRDITQALQNGALCYITKPANLRDLEEIISVIAGNAHSGLTEALKRLSTSVPACIVS
ncbi:response regulator [Chitinophaga agrisoli]|uniref:Response regulator n=1 Tax=Chitinophaga agrisoli TaxID=2607653 RepID=A0A5B2VLP9_9BACT|nr:response regulator [Chitinophaga agrisoli]KAA2239784.1 response regulator [Chitinophaga agrisoli]